MSLDYKGVPEFNRDRELFLSSIDKNAVSTFIDKQTDTRTTADQAFDDITKLYLKGEALKTALGQMDPAGFIPVEDGASVVASIQRLYPGNDSYQVITFGMFKTACETIDNRQSALDEDYLSKFSFIDPKIESSSITTTTKSVNSKASDWISCYLERLSPFAGLLIAGKMADLSFLISPQLDINSEGGTGAFKSWGAQGAPVAIALMIELGYSLHEYNQTFKNHSNIPSEVHDAMARLHNDPSERKKILNAAGFDYEALQANQKFNDSKAIKDYAIAYIGRNQDNLNYHHWLAYLQVVQTQFIVRGTAAMAPTFSNKWRKFYKFQNTSVVNTVDTVIDNVDELDIAISSSLLSYLGDLNRQLNDSYNKTYQSFAFQVDPKLICCLVWFLGPMDLESLKKLSQVLKIATTGASFDLLAMFTDIGENVMINLINTMCHYLCIVLDKVIRGFSKSFFNIPSEDLINFERYCLGINLITNSFRFAASFVVNYIDQILSYMRSVTYKLASRQHKLAKSNATTRALMTLSSFIDHVIINIESVQPLCQNLGTSAVLTNDQIADQTFIFVSDTLPKLFPVLKMAETDRRKHFSDLQSFDIPELGIEVPGTNETGASVVYNKVIPTECGSENSASKNIELGKLFAKQIKGN